jgi:hypothetical protein
MVHGLVLEASKRFSNTPTITETPDMDIANHQNIVVFTQNLQSLSNMQIVLG